MPRTTSSLRRTFLALDHVFFGDSCEGHGLTIKFKKFRNAKSTFVFGEYHSDKKEILINIRLAKDDIPDYVVSAVIMHEMLHHVVGENHDVVFQKAEHRHPYYYESEKWCEQFLDKLISDSCQKKTT
jgi:predicted metal-dependent hydrolase